MWDAQILTLWRQLPENGRPEEVPRLGTSSLLGGVGSPKAAWGAALPPVPHSWVLLPGHTELRSALPAPGSDSSSEPCGDCRSFGKSQQSPRNTPEKGKYIYVYTRQRSLACCSHMEFAELDVIQQQLTNNNNKYIYIYFRMVFLPSLRSEATEQVFIYSTNTAGHLLRARPCALGTASGQTITVLQGACSLAGKADE